MPFDRLIRTVDRWAKQSGRKDVFAQIGPSGTSPKNIPWRRNLKPLEFKERMQNASAIVAHAGMGTILTALELNKPILVMPRRGDLRETRNDHQVATAKRFEEQGRLVAAYDDEELMKKLDELLQIKPGKRIINQASPELLERLRDFVDNI